jgi:hypothetical protein
MNVSLTPEEWQQVYSALCHEDARQAEIGVNLKLPAVKAYATLAEKVWRQTQQPDSCKYCGAELARDSVGLRCLTKNCQWEHGVPT